MRHRSRHHAVTDPTAEITLATHQRDPRAMAWVHEAKVALDRADRYVHEIELTGGDPTEERVLAAFAYTEWRRRKDLVDHATMAYLAMVGSPDSGRYAALDEGFRALGLGGRNDY